MVSDPITLLSFGGGQDSTAILLKIIYDPEFAKRYVRGRLIVIMVNTKNEHPETYKHIFRIRKLCMLEGIEFILLDPKGYTSDSWGEGLTRFWEKKGAIGSKAYPKTCTDKLKITPLYNYLEKVLDPESTRKKAFYDYAAAHGPMRVLIGIAKGEERRVSGEPPQKWMKTATVREYPLIDLGMDRQACQDYIEQFMPVPPPSNCMFCPFLSLQELLYLYYKYPREYYRWVALEQAKIEKNAYQGDLTKTMSEKTGKIVDNLGVWGKKLLPEMLKEALEKYGHMSLEELEEYKFSHGHCVASKY